MSKKLTKSFPKEYLQELASFDEGMKCDWDDIEEHTVVTNRLVSTSRRWSNDYELVFKDQAGQNYLTSYSVGKTEMQDEQPFEWDNDLIECYLVKPKVEFKPIVKYLFTTEKDLDKTYTPIPPTQEELLYEIDVEEVYRETDDTYRHGVYVYEVYFRKADNTYWSVTYDLTNDAEYHGLRDGEYNLYQVEPYEKVVTDYKTIRTIKSDA